MAGSVVRIIGVAVVTVVLTAGPAFAQSPTAPSLLPSPTPSKSWTFYMAIATIGIAALTLILAVVGYLVQAPGFRRVERPSQPPQATS